MLGCGTGEESKLLEEFGASDLIGIDLSVNSIKIANETYPQYHFITGDMQDLPFEDATFDFIYSSLTIHYSNRPIDVYSEIYRVLKSCGFSMEDFIESKYIEILILQIYYVFVKMLKNIFLWNII